jgi:hypothetical protein
MTAPPTKQSETGHPASEEERRASPQIPKSKGVVHRIVTLRDQTEKAASVDGFDYSSACPLTTWREASVNSASLIRWGRK